MNSAPPTLREAYVLLGLPGATDIDTARRAFREAVKGARPDLPTGDAERFRQIIVAWRLIQTAAPVLAVLEAPAASPAPAPVVRLTPMEAVRGARVTMRVGDRLLKVSVPPGLRTGEHLRLRGGEGRGDLYLPVLIGSGGGLRVMGDDLYMDARAPSRLLADGGRVEIDTWDGPRSAWIGPGLTIPIRIRLKGLGLPARGARPAGHLFVAFTAAEDAPSAAEDLLLRFTRVWTPDRLAA